MKVLRECLIFHSFPGLCLFLLRRAFLLIFLPGLEGSKELRSLLREILGFLLGLLIHLGARL